MELQQTLKPHFALNLSAYDKFYRNRDFTGLFRLRSGSSKVFLILNEYLNIYCIIIWPRDLFGAPKALKSHFAQKLSPFNQLCLIEPLKVFFGSNVPPVKFFLYHTSIQT